MYNNTVVVFLLFFSDFLTTPISHPVLLDTDVILDCQAEDYPLRRVLQYYWLFNGNDTREALPHTYLYPVNINNNQPITSYKLPSMSTALLKYIDINLVL